jgi:S-DNA-T family DNA segregation ATPase FtsK/SpoIIIE
MLTKLTLQRPGEATGEDLLVDADPTTTVAQLAGAVAQRDPRSRGGGASSAATLTFRVDGSGSSRVLDPDQALADAMLRSGDRIVVQSADGSYYDASDQRAAAATLRIEEGPGAGTTIPLRSGSSQVGRGTDCDVTLSDPMVSKRHARFNVTDVVEVIDLGSVNGVFVGGEPVERAVLRLGDRVLLGDTTLVLDHLRPGGDAADGGPAEPFNRSPYLDPIYPGEAIKAPEPPARPQPQRFPIIAFVAPLVFAAVMFAITQNPLSIVFMALSPVMMVGTWLESRRVMKAAVQEATLQYGEALDQLDRSLTELQVEEADARRVETPGTGRCVEAAMQRSLPLWARRPDRHGFLTIRLGLAALPTRTVVEMPQTNNTIAELWERLHEVVGGHRLVDDVPVVGAFPASGVIGISGSLDHAMGTARGVVAQVAALHSPAEVVLGGLFSAEAAAHWDWIKWLPHTTSDAAPTGGPLLATGTSACSALLARLRELIDQRSGDAVPGEGFAAFTPAVVVVVDDAAPVDRSLLIELAERGRAAGVFCIWVARTVQQLPAAAEVFVDHDPATNQALAGYIDGGRVVVPVTVEPLDGPAALAFARSLAPVVDSGASANELSDLPGRVSFVEEIGVDLLHGPDAVIDRWRLSDSLPSSGSAQRRRKLAPLNALVGSGAHGPVQLDLRAHGPHALVGGTTGSGKSEFLQSWIMGLATTHSPSRVTFLLVDYKGGAAFSECVKLPHTVGLVTDLTPHLVQRALKSLNAELRHREHILNRKKAKDVLELEQRHDPDCPPSLVIVVDEFAALVMEVPEFVDGVVNVAQRGRSLGLHLVLATQRPAGVIKDNLRANTNLRVALRMADEADSSDVIGTDLAATFDPALPGRAAVKTGPGRLSPFQAAYVGGWTTDKPPAPRIVISGFAASGGQEWPEPEREAAEDADPGPTDIERLVVNVADAAVGAAIPAPRKPWLAELASTYDVARPLEDEGDLRLISRTDERLVFGVLDDPANQAQVPVAFEPDRDGNMAVIGTGGSGKSAFLRTLAVAASLSTRGGPCHVYGLDFASRGLDMLRPLPNVGGVVTADDEERTVRLLRMLRATVDDRLSRYAAVKADSITDYRIRAGRPDEARILLLVDGYPAFRQEYESGHRMPTYELFQSIATDGRQAGIHVVLAADRMGAVPSSMSSVIQKWLMLRMANENDFTLAGVPADAFPPGSPAGRGWFEDREVQVAVLGGSTSAAGQAGAIAKMAAAARQRGIVPAPEIGSLPELIPLAELPTGADDRVTIGIADHTLGPLAIPLTDPIVVAGPPKSGKSATLAVILDAILRRQSTVELLYVGEGRSPLSNAYEWSTVLRQDDTLREGLDGLIDRLAAEPPAVAAAGQVHAVLVVDDLPRVGGWMEGDRIGDLAKQVVAAGGVVIADGETSALSSTYGLQQSLKVARTGFVLAPDQYDGENIFKTPLPRLSRTPMPPGRGYFIHAGRATKVQVALAERMNR